MQKLRRVLATFGAFSVLTGMAIADEPFVFGRGVNLVGNHGFYAGSTAWATAAGLDYYLNKGMRVFRIVLAWEWIQPKLGGDLDRTVVAALSNEINYLTAAGAYAIIDIHGFGRRDLNFGGSPNAAIIGESPAVTAAHFADLWIRLSNEFKANKRVIFNLMNEPHDQDGNTLVSTYNLVIEAIRSTDATNVIMVDGSGYSSGLYWVGDSGSNADLMLRVRDPIDNILFDVHQYLDDYGAGRKTSCNRSTGALALVKVTTWARANHKRLFLGEFSIGRNATCYRELSDMLAFLGSNIDVWTGYTWWGSYAGQAGYNKPDAGFWYSIDPGGGDAQDFSGVTPDDPRMDLLIAGPK
jgi:endoglucanase